MAFQEPTSESEEDLISDTSANESVQALDMKEYRRQLLCQMIGQECDLTLLKFLTLLHKYMDTDSTLCAHGIRHILAEQGVVNFDVDFMNSGDPVDEAKYHKEGYMVISADVGRGQFDQHNKNMRRGSSFELIVDYFKLWDEPGFTEMVELARATDNVERMDKPSIHHIFKGLPRRCADETNGEIDWLLYLTKAFELLDDYYHDRRHEASGEGRFKRKQDWMMKKLRNGFIVGQLGRDAGVRQAAYDNGADAVVFFDSTYVSKEIKAQAPDATAAIIQLNLKHRDNPRVKLHKVVSYLRALEATKRGVDTAGMDLEQSQAIPELGSWFIHGSGNMVACGTRSNPIEKIEQLTVLDRPEIYRAVRQVMARVNLSRNTRRPARKPTSSTNPSMRIALEAAQAKNVKSKKKAKAKKKTTKNKPVAKKKTPVKKKAAAKKKK